MSAMPAGKIIGLSFVALALCGCGDESAGDSLSVNPVANLAPIAQAGNDQTAFAQQLITLSGQGHDNDGNIVAYQWQQTDGITAELQTNGATSTFIAPVVNQLSQLTFALTITDNQGATASDRIKISVSPNSQKRIDSLTFTDAKLADCVNSTATDKGWATVAQLTRLDCANKGISSVGGMQNLTSLQQLNLSANHITTLAPLAKLTSLRQLDLAANGIVAIDALAGLSGLTHLNLGPGTQLSSKRNNIRDISPLAALSALIELNLSQNQISDISILQRLNQLNTITLNANQVRNIEALLDLPNVRQINLAENNNISCAALNELDTVLGQGQLTQPDDCLFTLEILIVDVDFVDPNLKSCVLDTASSEGWLSIGELSYLTCDDQQITDLTGLQSLKALQQLDLSGNQIIDISVLFELTSTTSINLTGNPQIACTRLTALQAVLGTGVLSRPVNCADITLISDIDFVDPILERCVRYTAQLYQWTNIADMSSLHCPTREDNKDNNSDHQTIGDLRGLEQLNGLNSIDFGSVQFDRAISCDVFNSIEAPLEQPARCLKH